MPTAIVILGIVVCCSLLQREGVHSATLIEVLQNASVELSCSNHTGVNSITWSRISGNDTNLVTYVASTGNVTWTNTASIDVFGFNVTTYCLLIKRATLDIEDDYYCILRNNETSAFGNNLTVEVIIRPSAMPVITVNPSTVPANGSVTVTSNGYNIKPGLSATTFVFSLPGQANVSGNCTEILSGKLSNVTCSGTLRPSRMYNGQAISTTFIWSHGSFPPYVAVASNNVLSVTFKPTTITASSTTATEGQNTEIVCQTNEGFPYPEINIRGPSNAVIVSPNITRFVGVYNGSTTRLSYQVVTSRVMNGYTYNCSVNNTDVFNTTTLNILYPPAAVVTGFQTPIVENTNMTLSCGPREGNPSSALAYEWDFIGAFGNNYSVNGSVLRISKLQYSDTGVYTCTLKHVTGNVQTAQNITVEYSPVDLTQNHIYVNTSSGGSVNLTVYFRAYSESLVVVWSWGSNYNQDFQYYPISGKKDMYGSTRVIPATTTSDFGDYFILVRNKVGSISITLTLTDKNSGSSNSNLALILGVSIGAGSALIVGFLIAVVLATRKKNGSHNDQSCCRSCKTRRKPAELTTVDSDPGPDHVQNVFSKYSKKSKKQEAVPIPMMPLFEILATSDCTKNLQQIEQSSSTSVTYHSGSLYANSKSICNSNTEPHSELKLETEPIYDNTVRNTKHTAGLKINAEPIYGNAYPHHRHRSFRPTDHVPRTDTTSPSSDSSEPIYANMQARG